MKVAGWIFLVIGVLSFMGAALKGSSVGGPAFWIALGAFLLYKAGNKESADDKDTDLQTVKPCKDINTQSDISDRRENETARVPVLNQQLESVDEIQSHLTLQQREAAMCLISFFGGYCDNLMEDAPILIFKQAAYFFGLPDTPQALSKIMSKYIDADALVDIVLTIKHVKAKEFLLLTCCDLTKLSDKSEAFDLLFNIANDMGYEKAKFITLIKQYQ